MKSDGQRFNSGQISNISGTLTAIVTPMIYGEIDAFGLQRLVNYQIRGGVDAIVSCGTTGESSTLSIDEHQQVIDLTIKYVNGRIPVIAGTGSNSTMEAIHLTRMAQKSGADAILSVSPYYNRPSQEGIYQHFATIASESAIPIILYDVPSRTGSEITPEIVAKLAMIPNIIGIKDATGNLHHTAQIIQKVTDKNFIVLSGNDAIALPTIAIGGQGVVSVVSNCAPKQMSKMINFALSNQYDIAQQLHKQLLGLMDAMFCYPSPAPAKKALELLHIIQSAEVRLPMTGVDEDALFNIMQEMKKLNLLS